MSKEDEEKKKRTKALKFLKQEFDLTDHIDDDRKKEKRRQRQCSALRRILRTYMPHMKVKSVYEKLVMWCDSQEPAKTPTIFLLNQWCEHRFEWDNEKKSNNNEGENPDERRKKAKEFLEETRRKRKLHQQDS